MPNPPTARPIRLKDERTGRTPDRLRRAPRALVQGAALQVVRLIGTSLVLALLGVALVASLTLLQGQRAEVRRVDAALLTPAVLDSPARLAYAIELYRRGYADRFMLMGPAQENARATLIQHGLPDGSLISTEMRLRRGEQMALIAALAREHGIGSVLLVGSPGEQLLELKAARDVGLRAYGAPLPEEEPALATLVQASLDYWAYVLLGQ